MNKKHFFRKGTAAFLTAALLFTGMPLHESINTSAADTYYYGDLDGSSTLDGIDLCIMKKYYAEPSGMTAIQLEICDLDDSGAFDAVDVKMLQDYLLARINGFPAGVTYTL